MAFCTSQVEDADMAFNIRQIDEYIDSAVTHAAQNQSLATKDRYRITSSFNYAFIPVGKIGTVSGTSLTPQALDQLGLQPSLEDPSQMGKYIQHPDKPWVNIKVARDFLCDHETLHHREMFPGLCKDAAELVKASWQNHMPDFLADVTKVPPTLGLSSRSAKLYTMPCAPHLHRHLDEHVSQ